MKSFAIALTMLVMTLVVSMTSFAVESLSEDEMGLITAQDGATFVIEDFDFYITSPGVTYLDSQDESNDAVRGSMTFENIEIHDGISGPAILSTNFDWDIYSQTFGDADYNFAKFNFYNTSLIMDMDSSNIVLSPYREGDKAYPFDIGGLHIHDVTINNMTAYLGAVSNNTGVAGEIDLNLKIGNMVFDIMRPQTGAGTTPFQFNNIMVCGSFTGSEPEYDSTVSLAETEVPGLWSEERATEYAGGDLNYKAQLLAANRWKPDPASWVASGAFKIGDVENGNPMRINMTVDNNYYIPFPYDIVSGEPSQDSRVEWYEAESGELFTSDRGWRDGKDNYLTDGTNYRPIRNPRYGKAYISIDTPISGSLRIGSEGGDIFIVDGIDLQIHAEIPGYGYGNTPNSIPRPYPDPDLVKVKVPVYDVNNKINNMNYNDLWR